MPITVRIGEATAEALLVLEARSEVEQAAALGEELRTLLAEDVPAERAAALLELEVRRLTKAADRPTQIRPARTPRRGGSGFAAGPGRIGHRASS